MPMVGDTKFSYTDEGRRKAKLEATKTGQTMHVGYRKGGGVQTCALPIFCTYRS